MPRKRNSNLSRSSSRARAAKIARSQEYSGDYIEYSIGTVVVISTMAAAALGNTISDILGLGSAWYVERMAIRVGMKPPKLSPIQLDMPISRRFANLGRVLGVTIGCLLGMLPLLFLNKKLSNAEPHEDEE
uniref:Transmembrane protein 65 n=1 Tax=Timema monikensis TaxID=170555 RepID=A0A7R9HM37_9NEOP|nr:unnamed protein product [Timema monikensis]